MQIYLPIAEASENLFVVLAVGGGVGFLSGMFGVGGGFAGSFAGVLVFGLQRAIGQIDLVISLSYVILLGTIGALMLAESITAILKTRRHPNTSAPRGQRRHTWMHGLPFKMRFPR